MFALPSRHTAGLWSTDTQHGGAPAGLIAWAVEQVRSLEPMRLARLTIDLLKPIPLMPIEILVRVVREGRKMQLIEIRLLAESVEVVRASAMRIREHGIDLGVGNCALDVPPPLSCPEPGEIEHLMSPFVEAVDMRVARGTLEGLGAAAVWYRLNRPLVAGATISSAQRAAVAADFCSGTSAVLDVHHWSFVNGDISLNLARIPVGEWILVNAESWIGSNSGGLAAARLADEQGYFGRATQTLLISTRKRNQS